MHTADTDFRLFLQRDLVARCRRNPRYSLRAYARFLQLEPSALSRILRGRRALTRKMFDRLADRCEVGPEARETFFRHHFTMPTALPEVAYRELPQDMFDMMSDWYHWALTEWIQTETFSPDPRRIAKALGISSTEVHDALARLARLGIIEKTADGYRVMQTSVTTTRFPGSVAALRRLQRQYLEKAADALENVPIELRDQSTLNIALDPTLIPALKERIKKFRRDINALAEQSSPKRAVYALSISLYPLIGETEK